MNSSMFRRIPVSARLCVIFISTVLAACGGSDSNVTIGDDTSDLPRVLGATSTGNDTVLVSYSESMDDSATVVSNYTIVAANINSEAGSLIIESAAFTGPDQTTVEITTLSQSAIEYDLTARNVRSSNGEPLAPSTNSNGVLVNPSSAKFWGSGPTAGDLTDTDNDGLSDDVEQRGWLVKVVLSNGTDIEETEVTSDPGLEDTDGDGVSDFNERRLGMNPRKLDTDNDGLEDGLEFSVIWSSSIKQDTDGDGVSDRSEYAIYETSPLITDTDGDGFADGEEIFELSSEPLIADVPQAAVELVGELDMNLNITFSDSQGSVDTFSSKLVNEQSSTETLTNTWMERFSLELSQKVGGDVGFDSKGSKGGVSGELSATEGYVQENTTTWTESSTVTAREESERIRSESRNRTETASTATISAGVKLRNTGDVAFSLQNLVVTLLQRDPVNRSSFRTLATLNLDSAIADGITLGPFNGETGVLQVSNAEANASLVKDLLANPTGLSLEVGSFDLLDENGRNFAFLAQQTNARTALITIDFGNGVIERYRVATDVERKSDGTAAGIRLGAAFANILGLEPGDGYETADVEVLVGDEEVIENALVRIGDVATPVDDPDDRRFWVVLGSEERHVEPGLAFDDILLVGGDSVFIGFVTDKDGDGLFAREEFLVRTSDESPDTDGDGLSDYEEVKVGWTVTRDEVVQVYSDPLSSDSDEDGLSDIEERDAVLGATDPNDPDSDSDGLCDGPGTPFGDSQGVCRRSNRDPKPLEPALTVPPQVVFLDPEENSVSAARDTNILVTFDQKLFDGGRFFVNGTVNGIRRGNTSSADNGRSLIFDSDLDFAPGERIEVSLPASIQNIDRIPLNPKVYRFTASSSSASVGNFLAPRVFRTGDGNFRGDEGLATGDFNNDGLIDFAVGNQGGDEVRILINQGDGGFDAGFSLSVSGSPRGLAAADFDKDGRLDLAVANGATGRVGILLNIGDGRFLNFANYNVVGHASDVTVGDYDNDGLIDIGVADAGATGNGARVLYNNGDRTFTAGGGSFDLPVRPESIATADFNGDDIDDLVLASGEIGDCGGNSPGAAEVTVLLSGGTRNTSDFDVSAVPTLDTTVGWAQSVATGDFDADGAADIAVLAEEWGPGFDPPCSEIQIPFTAVLLNLDDGTGSFATAVRYDGGGDQDIAAADWDTDGDSDIGFNFRGDIVFLPNRGDGSFDALLQFDGGEGGAAIAAAQLNGDNSNDVIVTTSDAAIVKLNAGTPGTIAFVDPPEFNGVEDYRDIAGADLDSDGNGDFVTLEGSFLHYQVMAAHLADGNGGLAANPFRLNVVEASSDPRGGLNRYILADVDGNGAPDIVVTHDTSATSFSDEFGKTTDHVEILLNLGNGAFAPPSTINSGGLGPVDVDAGDFDGDGDLDLAVAHEGDYVELCDGGCPSGAAEFTNPNLAILLNQDNIGFATGQRIAHAVAGNPPADPPANALKLIASGDFDSDGALDLALLLRNGRVDIYMGNGDATFTLDSGRGFATGAADIDDMQIADFDRDLDLDIAFAAASGDFGLIVHLNDGAGMFADRRFFLPDAGEPQRMISSDFDGDGAIDLALAMENEEVLIMRNDSAGFFDEAAGYVGAIGSLYGLAPGDVDGDGDLDIGVVAIRGNLTQGQGVRILINE